MSVGPLSSASIYKSKQYQCSSCPATEDKWYFTSICTALYISTIGSTFWSLFSSTCFDRSHSSLHTETTVYKFCLLMARSAYASNSSKSYTDL